MVPIPAWFGAFKPFEDKTPYFDPATRTYVFSGSLLKLTTATLAKFSLPKEVWFGAGAKSGINAQLTLKVVASLNPAKQPLVTLSGKASVQFLGKEIVQLKAPGSGFGVSYNLHSRTLVIRALAVTLAYQGKTKLTPFSGKAIAKPPFKVVPSVTVDGTYSIGLTLSFNTDGTLKAGSKASFAFTTKLQGKLKIDGLALGSPLVKEVAGKVLTALKGLNLPQLVVTKILAAAFDLTAEAVMTGSLTLNGVVQLAGTPQRPTLTIPQMTGKAALDPSKVQVTLKVIGFKVPLFALDIDKWLKLSVPIKT
jgi:hypothetical protein